MKKIIPFFLIFLIFNSGLIHALGNPGFKGCGEYLFKGVLINNYKMEKNIFIYKVNQKTNSEMTFNFKESEDLSLMASYLNRPTELTGIIEKKMDGTKGEISHIIKVNLRKRNPLAPLKDSGIFILNSKNCK